MTIEMIAKHGVAGTSLARIAEAAGLSKAAVLYHFSTRGALIEAALSTVVNEISENLWAAMSSANTAADSVDAYLRAMIGYMIDHPDHVEVLAEGFAPKADTGGIERADRWIPLAAAIERAQAAEQYRPMDAKVAAVALGGAVDALVEQWMHDPEFDLRAAGNTLIAGWRRAAAI